ncbi:MAG: DUF2442 domain-containing protein, partial [Acidimicrobiales bacterium]
FKPLRDIVQFNSVSVDPELGTLVWPNGADLDPEGLHAAVRPIQGRADAARTPRVSTRQSPR